MNLLTALQYGAPGLSGVMLILAFRMIQTEQRRTTPRQAILRYTIVFMAFAFALLAANVFLQIIENQKEATQRQTDSIERQNEAERQTNAIERQKEAIERQTDTIKRQADAECAGALNELRATIASKELYEFERPNPDHSKLQTTILALKSQSEKSLKACGVLH